MVKKVHYVHCFLCIMILVLDSVILHHFTGVKVRLYCQVGKVNEGRFALDVSVRTLEFYKE